jgi:CheY-like chemotaxis protein
MSRRLVLAVGNCDPDHAALRRLLVSHFDVEVTRVMFVEEALHALALRPYDLVLVNRRIFADNSDGAELIQRMKTQNSTAAIPVMLISNFADAQDAAVAAGAVPGFGKAALDRPETVARLSAWLGAAAATPGTAQADPQDVTP